MQLQLRKAQVDAGGSPPLKLTTEWHTPDKEVLTPGRYEIVPAKEAKKAEPGELRAAVVVDARDDSSLGKIVQVRISKDAPASTSSSRDSSCDRERKKREERQKANRAASLKANALVAAKIESVVGNPNGGAAAVKMLQQLVAAATGCGGADACRLIAKRRQLDPVEHKDKYGSRFNSTRDPVRQLAFDLDNAKELLGLLAEVIAAHLSNSWGFLYGSETLDKEQKEFWAAFGVDRQKLLKEVEAEKTLGPGVLSKKKQVKEKVAIRKAGKKAMAKVQA